MNQLLMKSSDAPEVFVAQGQGPYENTRNALAGVDLAAVRGKRVLLKPNMGRVAQAGSGVITHPDVVAAAIDCFQEAGAEVAIGESPITGVDVMEAFEVAGITAVAEKRNCPLIDMDRRPFVVRDIPEAQALSSLKLCPEIPEFDLVVSIPVMKMHMHTVATLSIKNMKGCLWRRSKVQLHMLPPVEDSDEKPINIAIADMASVLRPDLAIIDGTVGMEGLGPSAGQAKEMGAVVVSADGFAADAVACQLMGMSAESVPHLRMGAERGYGIIDLDRCRITPSHWRDWVCPFAPPPANLTVDYPNITVLDNNSCSACQSTLLLFLKRYGDHIVDYFPDGEKLNIAIGKGHTELPEKTICVGNCTINQRDRGTFIQGCPPVASEILKAITGKPSIDDRDGRAE
jgi:uncharacterized protein (DUF362 family)